MSGMKKIKFYYIAKVLSFIILAAIFGIILNVITLWVWTGCPTKIIKTGWHSYYISKSIAESKEKNAYICQYKQISRHMSYPSSLYVPPIKEAFAEKSYDRYINKDENSGDNPYIFKIREDWMRVVVMFDDSIKKPQSYFNWHIKNLGGFFPEYSKGRQNMELPDTLILDLYYVIPDSIVSVPMGTIRLKRIAK